MPTAPPPKTNAPVPVSATYELDPSWKISKSDPVPTRIAAPSLKTTALSDASHVISLVPSNNTSSANVVNPLILNYCIRST